ncbi:hypothetical protein KJ359_011868 [Pestalotiopsis sp. 9143b]|nr:hypothetical protein KJ359_011868 [Pestalotiopsis sp. 9143b]
MIVNHAYLDDSTLLITPSDGWSDISTEGEHDETIGVCYTDNQDTIEPSPLSPHCIVLAHSVDREGTNSMLDADRGTVTSYCITGSDITIPDEENDALPDEE